MNAENLNLKYPNDAKKEVPFSTSDINMITTNLTDKKKVNLPLQASDYGWNDSSNVADFVRCSMSIPFFFSPVIHKHNERDIYFVDGGALSNFPINIFHNPKVKSPRLPVFGVKLDSLIVKENSFTFVKYVADLIETIKSYGDKEFLKKNTFYEKHCVKVVDTSGFNSLNFSMDENEKIELFALGARAAIEFLHKFNWSEYKEDRKKIFEIRDP
ncbi:MAG: patatin-like phospholipase family protein [Saprospiraceae bacterium]|nr:patatin-like phospholipase family protein [Saprospiraceae bacterium]